MAASERATTPLDMVRPELRARAVTDVDRRFMAAAIRLAERHVGLTGTNPSVGALIVRGDGEIVGRGVTACGGRPHAERIALDEAGTRARGATAYVTLEPCAHHGMTPPCAEALVAAGIHRVVVAADDPDPRVDGRGYAILRAADIEVVRGVETSAACASLAGFLTRVSRGRPHVTLKVAVSADGFVGRKGRGQVAITGAVANRQTHLLRARSDAVLVGAGTAAEDDPLLTCRLPGLENRSPLRVLFDPSLRTDPGARLFRTADRWPTLVIARSDVDPARRDRIVSAGMSTLPLAFTPQSDDMDLASTFAVLAGQGVSSVLAEGGPGLSRLLLDRGLVDRLVIVRGEGQIGPDAIAAPFVSGDVPGFRLERSMRFGADLWLEFEKDAARCSPEL